MFVLEALEAWIADPLPPFVVVSCITSLSVWLHLGCHRFLFQLSFIPRHLVVVCLFASCTPWAQAAENYLKESVFTHILLQGSYKGSKTKSCMPDVLESQVEHALPINPPVERLLERERARALVLAHLMCFANELRMNMRTFQHSL